MKQFTIAGFFLVLAVVCHAQSSYYSGDGGRGIRLAVLEPAGRGLSANEQWMLSLVQGSITGDFNKFSAMTIIDRQNLEKILAEQQLSLSVNSEKDYIRLVNLPMPVIYLPVPSVKPPITICLNWP